MCSKNKGGTHKEKIVKGLVTAGPLLVALLFLTVWKIIYSNPFASSWDKVDFALALERFDLLAMQPHFPGYPYFILGGMVVHRWVENPVMALSIFNVLITFSAAIPLFLLCRKQLNVTKSLIVVIAVHTAIYLNILTAQPMSEGAAMAILWWYFWSLAKGLEKHSFFWMILPLFFFGILMGIRLSYLVFGIGIVYLWFSDWNRTRAERIFPKRFIVYLLFAFLFQLIWVLGLAYSEGSIVGFIQLSLSFVNGHFTEWGGSISTDDSIFYRLLLLFFYNFLWVGLAGKSIIMAVILCFLFIITVFYHIKEGFKYTNFQRMLVVMGLIYFLYALFAQNIDKPRHIAPLIGISYYFGFMFLLLRLRSNASAFFTNITTFVIVITLSVQLYVGLNLVKKQAEELPATYKLANFLENIESPFIIYTWEETRVFEYLNVSFPHERLFTYSVFTTKFGDYENQRIFITKAVAEGFESQGIDLTNKIELIGKFNSNPLFDPVYHDIILYEWIK